MIHFIRDELDDLKCSDETFSSVLINIINVTFKNVPYISKCTAALHSL